MVNEKLMMRCGHAANATGGKDNKPCCVICLCYDTADVPNLVGRMSKCTDCGKTKPSAMNLPFFGHRPDREFDSHYDGCYGWD